MSTALEVLGMSLPYSSGIPAVYPGIKGNSLQSQTGIDNNHQKRYRNVAELLST